MVKGIFVTQRMICAALAVLVLSAPASAQRVETRALPPNEILTLVHLAKLEPIGQPVRSGPNYVVRATDRSDREVRVVITAESGDIVSVTPAATASRTPPASAPPASGRASPPISAAQPNPDMSSSALSKLDIITAEPERDGTLPSSERGPRRAAPTASTEPVKRAAAMAVKPEPLPKPRPDERIEAAPPPEPVKRVAAVAMKPEPLPKPRPQERVEAAPPPEPVKRVAIVAVKPEPLPKPRPNERVEAAPLPSVESRQSPAGSPAPRTPPRLSNAAPLSLHANATRPDQDDGASAPSRPKVIAADPDRGRMLPPPDRAAPTPQPVKQAFVAPPKPESPPAAEARPEPTMVAMSPRSTGSQGVVVIVNGDPVTNFDIEQRHKLVQATTQKAAARDAVIEELIVEKLKIQMLRRYNIPDVDKDVDNALTNMARRMRQSSKEFADNLARQGIMVETLKSRMKADIVWSQIIRGRYQSSFQFSDSDVQARLKDKSPAEANMVGHEYTLRPILFVVPRGSPPTAFEARMKEAEALRARFQNCEEGIPLARGTRYVAVRPAVIKGSAELPPALRDVLAKTEVGRLTGPETTQQGIEVYAVCGKRQSDNAPAKKEIRDAMYSEVFANVAKTLLKELRSQAMIEYR